MSRCCCCEKARELRLQELDHILEESEGSHKRYVSELEMIKKLEVDAKERRWFERGISTLKWFVVGGVAFYTLTFLYLIGVKIYEYVS